MPAENIRAYVTQYALSGGVKLATGEVVLGSYFKSNLGFHSSSQWTSDPNEDVRRAEAMRVKKIGSLEKQIAKLRALKFTVPSDV